MDKIFCLPSPHVSLGRELKGQGSDTVFEHVAERIFKFMSEYKFWQPVLSTYSLIVPGFSLPPGPHLAGVRGAAPPQVAGFSKVRAKTNSSELIKNCYYYPKPTLWEEGVSTSMVARAFINRG